MPHFLKKNASFQLALAGDHLADRAQKRPVFVRPKSASLMTIPLSNGSHG
jgi:hypothetical protein